MQAVSNISGQLLLVFYNAGKTLSGLIPYVFAGIFLGEIFRNFPWMDEFIRWCHRATLVALLFAALLGVISPLCTYGTIPLILMLAGKGFHLSPLITFLVASSSLNPQLFFITLGGINAEMALVRLITVIIFSVLMGLIVRYLPEASILSMNKKKNPVVTHVTILEKGKGFKLSVKSMWKDLKYIGFFILLGCLIGAVIEVFVPADRISSLFGAGPVGSVLIASILGVPVYVCGGGTIPVIGSLLSKGLNEGAALSFLTVGQAVRITPLMALASLINIRYLIYLVCAIIIYAIFIGYTYQIIT